MSKPQVTSRRGLAILGVLVVSVVAAAGIGLAMLFGRSEPVRANFSARLIDAKEALVDGKFETAEVFARDAIERSPDSITARLLLSKILRAAGKLTASRQILDKIHKENPEQVEVL